MEEYVPREWSTRESSGIAIQNGETYEMEYVC